MAFTRSGMLTAADQRSTRVIPFDVPEGTTSLNIHLTYDPLHTEGADLPQQISMTVYDPSGFAAEINRPTMFMEQGAVLGSQPSAGLAPLIIVPGQWSVFLSTHRVVNTTVSYTLTVTFFTAEATTIPALPEPVDPTDPGAGWYKGDLHAHTWYSDGRWSPADLVTFMTEHGLDFVSLTDHNTVAGLAEHFALASDDVLTLGGSEVSTFHGHMLAYGIYERVEWRDTDGSLIPVPKLASNIHAAGGLAVICHPRNVGDPLCCGCRWEHNDMMPGNAGAVEIWNGSWSDENAQGVALWQTWLAEGYRLTATAGTDHHGQDVSAYDTFSNLRPAWNVVYAESKTRAGIVTALRAGHSYVTAKPQLHLVARAGEHTWMMGDVIDADHIDTDQVTIDVSWHEVPTDAHVQLRIDGKVTRLAEMASGQWQDTFDVRSFRWLVLEVWDDTGAWAFSNPLYGQA